MLLRTVLVEHLAQATKRRARSLANDDFGIAEATLNQRPKGLEMGLDEERASLDDDSEGGDSGLAHRGVWGLGEFLNLGEERGEDLGGREGGGEGVDDAEGGAGGDVVLGVGRLWLRADREESVDDGPSKVELLDGGLLPVDSDHIISDDSREEGNVPYILMRKSKQLSTMMRRSASNAWLAEALVRNCTRLTMWGTSKGGSW